MLIDVMSKKLQFYNPEEALVGVDDDAMHSETVENYS